ncbi:MAG: hypothetical protein GTO55_00915 [Armatimonadetes bacterium]|nr:hypothetical protein [Armatimonadota bacterium]NIM22845.1 hypothetical protein [Armatimonadota bacterium]NIM66711.1 hypothetical protein [Armatimonadota bacterium]NIM75268.1 hypothetical protein [Armatimonadota bacterium]NIN04908.1 hypothetical protein [Armatimonadota bacterium]
MTTSLPEGGAQIPQAPMKAHRGTAILVLGIVALVFCFICTLVTLVCAIIAWVMGNNDLREMDQGLMDPSGRGMTSAGRICGIIAIPLGIVMTIVSIIVGGMWLSIFNQQMRSMPMPR